MNFHFYALLLLLMLLYSGDKWDISSSRAGGFSPLLSPLGCSHQTLEHHPEADTKPYKRRAQRMIASAASTWARDVGYGRYLWTSIWGAAMKQKNFIFHVSSISNCSRNANNRSESTYILPREERWGAWKENTIIIRTLWNGRRRWVDFLAKGLLLASELGGDRFRC